MTIAREVTLRKTAEGIRLVQKPVREQAQLREKHFSFDGGDTASANAWLATNRVQGELLEFVVEFASSKSGVQGIKVFKGAKEETVIGVDRDSGRVFLDRTRSGNVNFHPKFAGVQDAPLPNREGKVKLHIFVDACSVEIFVNDGESVITDLVFPSADSRGIEFFGSTNRARISSAELWTLRSAWK